LRRVLNRATGERQSRGFFLVEHPRPVGRQFPVSVVPYKKAKTTKTMTKVKDFGA